MIRKLFFLIMTHAVLVSWLSSGRRSVARSSSSSTSAGRLYLARAFSTPRLAPRTHVWSVQQDNNNNKHGRFLTSTTGRRFMSTIQDEEQDLDAALDSILGDHQAAAQQQQSSTKPTTTRLRIEKKPILEGGEQHRGAPMPPTLVEQDDPIDFRDPEFLSTSNPRWVQAGLSQKVIDVLSSKGITHLTPVQAEAFDPVLARRDVIGRSRTGTGKTLAFGMPALTRLVSFLEETGVREAHTGRMARGRGVAMIVLCPTRELARQVADELREVARPLQLHVECFHGGVPFGPQAKALQMGVDVLVGTPGRVIDHLQQGSVNLAKCDIAVLDEADEMLNMGFADDVETILKGVGSANEQKTQCLMFSATTPPWVKQIGRQYQEDVLAIDSTGDEGGARVATTVRHTAIQLPPGSESKMAILEDIIAVEISRDHTHETLAEVEENKAKASAANPIAAAAKAKKAKHHNSMQQKIFGKTIVFVETKRLADELVSGNVFKSLTAQALHGDVGQKQRDATLNAFRSGAFNVLVATDVAARGIDIKDVDLVVQFDPPRDVDSYVHRSGRTGRAGNRGVSVLLFNRQQARDIVRIERDLGHGFKFDLVGPPSAEMALRAAAKTSAMACQGIPEETVEYFMDSAAALLEDYDNPQDVIARCLAAISRRATEVQSRSLITGELGLATLEMKADAGRAVAPNEVMFTVGKLSRLSQNVGGDVAFDNDIGKIQTNPDTGSVFFDMSIEEAKKLVAFSKDVDAGGAQFSLVKEMEIERDRFFGSNRSDRREGGGGGDYGGRYGGASRSGSGGGNNYRKNSFGRDNSHTGRSNRYGGGRDYEGGGGGGGSRGGYQGGKSQRWDRNDGYQGGGGGRRYESSSAGAYQSSGEGRGKYGSKSSGGGGGDSGWYK